MMLKHEVLHALLNARCRPPAVAPAPAAGSSTIFSTSITWLKELATTGQQNGNCLLLAQAMTHSRPNSYGGLFFALCDACLELLLVYGLIRGTLLRSY